MENKALTYKEFIELAEKHYINGGCVFVECWEEYQFNDYVRMFGEITEEYAMEMFARECSRAFDWAKHIREGGKV